MATTVQQFDYSVNLLQAVLWQYDKAPRLLSLLRQKAAWYAANFSEFWSDWYRDVFNLETANEFGLSVWGRILDVPLVTSAPGSGARPVFGFGVHNRNFFDGNFGRDTSGVINLTVEQKRLVLKLRYYQLISTGTVPETNAMLRRVFGAQGRVYLLDGHDMTQTYVFSFVPAQSIRQVLQNFDILPRPQAVASRILVQPSDVFGFAPYYLNFENSNFGGSFLS